MIFSFHKINKKALIFSAFFLLYTIAIRGQQDTIVVLDSFVVTASRLPQPKNSIHTHTISPIVAALAQGTSINDFIQAAPGIFTMSKTNYAQDTRITSRGFGARSSFGIRGIKIWVDEVPETTPDGQSQLDNLDYSMLHHMEILRGPDAALYGNVSGAMIKISPTPFDSLNQGFRLRLAGGSNGFRQAGIQLVPKSVRWKWHMGYTYQASDGYRAWSKFRNHIGNIRGRYVKGNHELKILINGVFNPQSQDPGALNEGELSSNPQQARSTNFQYKAGENLHQERIALIYKKVNNSTYHQVKAYFLNRQFTNYLGFLSSGLGEIKRKNHGIYLELGNLLSRRKYNWIVGADWQYQQDFRSNFDNLEGKKGTLRLAQNELYKDLSAYTLNSYQFTDRWRGELNARISGIQTEMNDQFLSDGNQSGSRSIAAFSPSIKLSYQLNREMSINFINSTGFESPTLTELSVNSAGTPGFNPTLENSKTRLYEAHFHFGSSSQKSIDFHWFRILGTNEIIANEIPGSPGRFFYQNTGASRRYGFELSAKWPINDNFQLSWNYTNNYHFQLENKRRLPGIPEYVHQIQLIAEPVKKLVLRMDHQFVGKVHLTSVSEEKVSSYIEANFQSSFTFQIHKREFVFNLGFNNIYNSKYNANIRINAAGNRYYEPAQPINFWTGVQFLW